MPPVQDEQLTLTTKKRLQNLRRRSLGLQQLAVREISKQLTFYRTHPDELKKLKSLPGVLRDKILQVLMKKRCFDKLGREIEFENLIEIFPLLLSPRTRYIELNGILSFCPGQYNERKVEKVTEWCAGLLKQIETRAPQVETLIINRNNPYNTMYSSSVNAYINQDMVRSLMKMQKLNRLNVNLFNFPINNLLKICKNIPRLQYINIGCIYHKDEILPAPEEVLSSFCNLKELVFQFPRFEWLGCFCTRNLPNIEVVQYDPNKIMDSFHFIEYSDRYQRLDFPGASNLRHICVDLIKDKAKEVEAMSNLFPKVTCLMVKNTKNSSLEVMPKFDNIRQLHLLDLHQFNKVIEKYLVTYGQKLQSLYLGNAVKNSSIDLEWIFKYCPKLEKLSLLNVDLKTTSSKIEFYAELKELEWVFDFFDGYPDRLHEHQIIVLSSILSAPKLEIVKLDVKNVNQNDLLILNSLIKEKRILNNLHTLHVYFRFPMYEALAHVAKSACEFLPKLTDFKSGFRNEFLDPLIVVCQSSPLDVSVFEMNSVFDIEN